MTNRYVRLSGLVLLVALGVGLILRYNSPAQAAEAPVGLGTADSFAVLAGTTVTNTGPSVITGDVGVSPGSAIVGFPPGIVVGGVFHAADAVALQAQNDTTTAYNDAAGRTMTAAAPADLAGQTLVGGVYTGPTLGLTGTVTLDAQGDPNTVWIFQSASTLITSSSSVVSLINGAQACNVYWQIGSSATLGTNSTFVGTVLALTSITANTDATIQGRLLARNGAVTLDDNTIIRPSCAPPTTTTTSPTTIPGSTTTSSVPGSTTSSSVPGSTTSSSVPGSTTSSSVPGSTTSSTVPGSTTSSTVPGSTTTIAGGGGTTTTTAPLGGPGGRDGRSGPSGTAGTSRNLPRTGNNLTPLAVGGLLTITLGAALILAARRRNASRTTS